MTQKICFKNKFGYCKYRESCFFQHVTLVCDDDKCDIFKCDKRHPKICKWYRDFRWCKFTLGCKFKHENKYDIFEKFDKKLEELKAINNNNGNDDLAKKAEEKLESVEKMLENQRKEIGEKNAQIASLELRMDDLEKKFTSEKKTKDKKIKQLENAVKNKKSDDEKKVTQNLTQNCKYCDFETTSGRGLKVHMRRKHTNVTDADYPAECEFCDLELKSESDMKMHLKISHTYSETKFKCEDCDFCCVNELTMEVHHGKCHTDDFECGLCDYKAENIENLQTHLITCESYECENCFFRVHHLSQMEVHMDEKHEQQNLNIIHGKIDRKNENIIKTTEHLRFNLFA